MTADFEGLQGAALVTGGSGAVGTAVCRRLAERGADVAFAYHGRHEQAEATKAAVGEAGREVESWHADLADPAAARALVDGVIERFGALHTFVHAAGPFVPQAYISTVEPDDYRRQLNQEAGAYFNVVQPLLPHLRRSQGAIVAVTTVALRRFPVRDGLSPATKGAIEGLTRVIAGEEGRYGVRANCVGPGILGEGMTTTLVERGEFGPEQAARVADAIPLRRLGTAADVAEVVCFLASPRAAYVTGQSIDVDGGYSI